jgi:hypothetical protein
LTYFVEDPDNSKGKLFYLLKENRKTTKGVLAADATGDRQVEFKYNTLGELEPRDPRYRVITAQPFASSSYGVLQATLTIFDDSKLGKALKEVFDPSAPLDKKTKTYNLLPAPDSKAPDPNRIDPQFEITARHHAHFKSILLKQPTFQYCEPLTPCTEDRWKKQWKQIVKQYNSGGPVYQRGEIIDNAFEYHTPKPMQ